MIITQGLLGIAHVMKTNKRMAYAYGVELGRIVTIAEARREYFQQAEPRRRFAFLCSSPACRAASAPPKVTGVNYDKWPQDDVAMHAAHFRANPVDEHVGGCEWIDLDEDEHAGESEADALARQAKRKLHDYVDVFEPDRTSATDAHQERADPVLPRPPALPSTGSTRTAPRRSNSLERLVECYRNVLDLRREGTLSDDEFDALTLRVPERGEIKLRSYFAPMRFVREGANARVMFGGATLKRYGLGFRFFFYDKFRDQDVSLYVPSSEVANYRYRRYLDQLLQMEPHVRYFTVYARGRLEASGKGAGYGFLIDDLQDLVVVLGPRKADVTM